MASNPRLFISYSWSSVDHEQWVLDLATELVHSGVDVVFDKWALREGHDSIAFMETMVTDTSITKVILVCDQAYATKADGRAAGVGTETQIISAEVYAKESQDKFVAVIAETDKNGKPFLPTYYKSRIYVDLSEVDRYSENFEKLLRWIFDKPLHVRPELGEPPSFIVDPDTPILGTSALAKRVIEGVKADKSYTKGAFDEYLARYSENLERFRTTTGDQEPYDLTVKSIGDFSPSRNEFIQVLAALIQYSNPAAHIERLHRFFETLIPYLSHPPETSRWSDIDFDNFRFIVHELFLYTLALLLSGEHIEAATYLLSQDFYVQPNSGYGQHTLASYTVFLQQTKSLKLRAHSLKLNRHSLRADLLEERSKSSTIPFRRIMEADFVCFFRADLTRNNHYGTWWPETLVYAGRQHGPFELFARSSSKKYLARTLNLLGIPDLAAINTRFEDYAANNQLLPRWQFESFDPHQLLGFEQLGTRP